MDKTVFCVAAHPDDIEFMMAGTLILLGRAGYTLHIMNLASGSCGTAVLPRDEIVARREREARNSAALIGAVFHPSLVDDLEIFYERPLLARLAAIVREVNPQILLLPSPQDYMEDHMNTSRLMVTAAFCRGMLNYITEPPLPPVSGEMALYHALPYGLADQLRRPIRPDFYIDIGEAIDLKRQMLACHQSQKDWLDQSQGKDSYLQAMADMAVEVGRWSRRATHAEAWRRHSHLGFGAQDFDPLHDALENYYFKNEE